MAPRTYFSLVTRNRRQPVSKQWGPEFGDYDRKVVAAELDDYRRQGWAAAELRIIETAPDQMDIDAAVAALNAADSTKVASS